MKKTLISEVQKLSLRIFFEQIIAAIKGYRGGSGGDVERLWSDKDGLWYYLEYCGGCLWWWEVAAYLGTEEKMWLHLEPRNGSSSFVSCLEIK
nr:hypothetical protein [Tanacetum cinerariifolium]